ncbi:uncharacterized protein UHOD_01623 [Ustilago sp. UG-2017b]|nr:uncharacterized protein UHOD_01623 [Ustilago sp. UG-2017b]
MVDDIEQVLYIPSPLETSAVDAAFVPLPDSSNDSLAELAPMQTAPPKSFATSSDALLSTPQKEVKNDSIIGMDSTPPVRNATMETPARKTNTVPEDKPMSPEKAALAAMFDSIKMPPPVSPSKSPRKASGSSILTSPPKQAAGEAAPTAFLLFRQSSSPSTSPSKVDSTDSAASKHFSKDSPLRQPVVISSSSSPGTRLHTMSGETKNASTPLSPAPTTSSTTSRPPRMRPSMMASSSSPSARLSDLSMNLDTTGTQELLFNQDTSFLAAAANTAADITIDDSFDVSRARARIQSASATAASLSSAVTHRSSPAKLGGFRAKPRCSVVPEESGVTNFKPRSLGKVNGNALGLRGLGFGRVVKNAAGDDTIELNLTGSFIGSSSMIAGNLMDESVEASLLFGNNSFSISHSGLQKNEVDKMHKVVEKTNAGRRNSSDNDDDDNKDEDFQRDAQNVQKWAAEAARKAQLQRRAMAKTPVRTVGLARASVTSTVKGPTAATSTVTRPVSRMVPRPSLVTPTAGSRLLKPHASVVPAASKPIVDRAAGLTRSGSASAGLSSLSSPAHNAATSSSAAITQTSGDEAASEIKTPMRSRRKSTFTSSRPPVSGPARRRESLVATTAATLQTHPVPPLPSLGPTTPGRSRTAPAATAPVGTSPSMKTPTAAARTIPKPRSSLTGRTTSVLPTPRASTSAGTIGAIPRPCASLTSSSSAATPSTRTTLSSSSAATMKTPAPHTSTIRSASLATPTARAATSRTSSVDATPVSGMRKSASQPQGLDLDTGECETPTGSGVTPRARILVPHASMSRLSIGPAVGASRTSQLVTPRAAIQRPSARPDSLAERSANNALVTPSAASKVGGRPKVVMTAKSRPSVAARSTAAGGGFGFKPRTWAVYVGPTRSALLDGQDKEN